MVPLQVAGGMGVRVLLASILALLLFTVIGALVTRDAQSRNMNNPAAWGMAVFLAMLFGTVFVANQLFGAIVAGLLVIGLYVVVRD